MLEDWRSETTVLLISLAIIPVLLALLILCLKIKTSKSNPDLFGVEGTVKKKVLDEAYTPSKSDKLNVSSGDDSNVRTPSYDRKLPDIPNDDLYKNSTKEDTNSELYATVDEVPNNNNTSLTIHPNINILPGSSTDYNDPKNHPYAKVKKQRRQEHPYAKVGDTKHKEKEEENTDTEEYDTTENLLEVGPAQTSQRSSGRSLNITGQGASGPTNLGTWVPPPRRPDEHQRNPSRQTTPLPPEPPFTNEGQEVGSQQQHFSGDSQDSFSAKGYTSISVREPLSMIRQPGSAPQPQTIQEGNYVTLSETSDEMYAAIEDTVYTNPGGVETGEQGGNDANSLLYSKVDKKKKKNDRHTKSYDPATLASNYATVNKLGGGASGAKQYLSQSTDNLGARPKQRSPCTSSRGSAATRELENVDYSEYEVSHVDRPGAVYSSSRTGYRDPGYETVDQERVTGGSHYAESQLLICREPGYELVPSDQQGKPKHHPDYETVPSELKLDPGYETVPGCSHHRERVNSIDPGYETVPHKRSATDPGYETVSAKAINDPGYETVPPKVERKTSVKALHHDPGYETVPSSMSHHAKRHSIHLASYGPRSYPPDYESVNRDPGYESVGGFKERDPGYETVPQSQSLEPGYETLPGDGRLLETEARYSKADHEARYSKVNKKRRAAPAARLPPQARFNDSNENDIESNYETLQDSSSGPGHRPRAADESEEEEVGGGYETIPADQGERRVRLGSVPRSQYDPGYETILGKTGGEVTADPDYDGLKDNDIEYIDESADEVDDEISRLQSELDEATVESTQSNSLIHMSVVDTRGQGGIRRSSVVVIEHVDMTPVPSADSAALLDLCDTDDQGINTHIFV